MVRLLKKSLIIIGACSIVYFVAKDWLYTRKGLQVIDFQKAKKECFQGGENWRYCVYTTENHQDDVFLYFLHGKNFDENVWNDGAQYPAQIQKYWRQNNMRPPKVITISYGGTWFITPKMTKKDTGLLDNFKTEVFKTIEERLGKPRYRMLAGDSMGGLNALILSFYMGDMFRKTASICPPLYKISPFASLSEIWEFIKSSGARPKSMMTIFAVARVLFANDKEWNQFSPVALVKEANPDHFPELYFTSGLVDRFGSYEGVLEFVKVAKKRNLNIHWRPAWGDHCSIDIPSLAEFLQP